MSERISGDPDRLEAYTARTSALLARERDSIGEYSRALARFLAAEPNDFGDGGVVDRTAVLEDVVDGLDVLDTQPEAFAFALRQLDQSGADALSTVDIAGFDSLVGQRLAEWHVDNPPTGSFATPGGRKKGVLDAYGNGWVWDPHKLEWDVQIRSNRFGTFSPDGRHANISPDGQVTH